VDPTGMHYAWHAHVHTPAKHTFAMQALCTVSLFASTGCDSTTATSMDGSPPESEASIVDGAPALDAFDAPLSDDSANDVAVSTDGPAQDSSMPEGSMAPDSGAFACAEAGTCNAATDFCQLSSAGDSGLWGQCFPLPTACLSAASCACLSANTGPSSGTCGNSGTYPVPCMDTSSQIVVRCSMP
jgi:hypothetical protein